jgi:V8-like Glu-specific endopeptidase
VFGETLNQITKEDMELFPHCVIGAITGRDKSGFLLKGSGVMISANLVLTAAHNIFDQK